MSAIDEKKQTVHFQVSRIPLYASAAINYNMIKLNCSSANQQMDVIFSVYKGSKHVWNNDMQQIRLDVQVLTKLQPIVTEYRNT